MTEHPSHPVSGTPGTQSTPGSTSSGAQDGSTSGASGVQGACAGPSASEASGAQSSPASGHTSPAEKAPLEISCAMAQCPFQSVPAKIWDALLPKPFYRRHPILIGLGVLILLYIGISTLLGSEQAASLTANDSIAVVRIEGVIFDTEDQLKWIAKLTKDNSVKGVLLRVDSPGGGAGASQELYEALRALDRKKPVVASLGSTAASGGIMVSMAGRYIVANPSTVTGSIGVRIDLPQFYKLMDTLGIGQETITSGPYKAAGSPSRPVTDAEKRYFAGVIEDMHSQFINIIAESRKLDVAKVRSFADGKVFTGRHAKELGLVDELGGQGTALAKLHELTGVSEFAELKERSGRQRFLRDFVESLLPARLVSKVTTDAPSFLYQW